VIGHLETLPGRTGRRTIAAAALVLWAVPAFAGPPPAVSFNRDVRPILSENCFQCHGPDAARRKAGLRLDTREGSTAALDAGRAVVPGDPAASLLLQRVVSADAGERMPPRATGRRLTPEQVEVLRRWVRAGAPYQRHWSLIPAERPPLPAVADSTWPRNAIDTFILARLEKEGLRPSPEAAKSTLLRRVSLDLTGLPPTPRELDDFLADSSPDAYEKVVDRLLASPAYGERMALVWLDLARYADTNGYNNDEERTMWAWRDWVLDAFNDNMAYDRFVTEQIAGDLLAGATPAQKLATGFNRNHVITTEGGIIPEEYRIEYVADRVHTTSSVFLGLSFGCARCHDHKFDPISQKDYYRFFAFFNNIQDHTIGYNKGAAAEPYVRLPSRRQQAVLHGLDRRRRDLEEQCRKREAAADEEYQRLKGELEAVKRERADFDKGVPTTMVMQELPSRRQTHVLKRGQYDQPGEKVEPAVPGCLPPLPAGAPANRLGLARWLVDPANPLTSRVAVNRWWQMYFGSGIVETAEDFGSQGAWPSHAELLDWLATELVRTGWDVKRMQRHLVTSATYRQSSRASPELIERDPGNRLLARGPRFRLPAETVRDNALAVSGLLVQRQGGPSVKPYQPGGLWEDVSVERRVVYKPGTGSELYRRSLYTYWKRTCPPPALTTFDAPDRETCVIRRARTNTPLQALVLLNDPTYVEAARKLAERILREGGPSPESRLSHAFLLAVSRRPRPAEVQVLLPILRRALDRFRSNPRASAQLVAIGASPRDPALDTAELAAWATVAGVILNLDETITKE
jgi:hypothetical protein